MLQACLGAAQADRTEGFSGADIAGICKAAAKYAIRETIARERRAWEQKEAALAAGRAAAEAKGEVFVEPEEAGPPSEDMVPYLTKKMLLDALANSRRSVTKEDLAKYMSYKRAMERRLGLDDAETQQGPVVGLDAEDRRRPGAAQAPTTAPAREFGNAQPAGADDVSAPGGGRCVRAFGSLAVRRIFASEPRDGEWENSIH